MILKRYSIVLYSENGTQRFGETMCGPDVHQRFVVACLSLVEAGERRKDGRSFGCATAELLITLRNWLIEPGGSGMCANPGFPRVRQRLIDHRLHKNRLPIWSGCVDSTLWNEGLL